MNVDKDTINILSLCTGGGGLDLGLSMACESFRVVCCVEHEAYCCEVLATRMENKALDEEPIWTNLKTFDGKPWCGVVDCIIGGYPCQPFSTAGKRLGTEDERHLWPDIARIIGEIEPGLCFFENVSGHLTIGFDTVCSDLRAMGYKVAAGLFTASEVGASHKRERLFILANSEHLGLSPAAKPRGSEKTIPDDPPGQNIPCEFERTDNPRKLADTNRANFQGFEPEQLDTKRRENENGPVGLCGRADIPIFPPAPSDLKGWRKVLETDPALEPAICRMAHGMASRVERLRMLGNGVVPLQAAYAFVSLWAALYHSECNPKF